ncbi:MAG TPA: hypothetical protein VEJ67_11930 [Candidatus Cybelea sp.]|nr:hypothetical protein [Candidatus Cybelea sp.]
MLTLLMQTIHVPGCQLLFWALDRLSREGVLGTLRHLNRLTSYGVGYRSFTEQYFRDCALGGRRIRRALAYDAGAHRYGLWRDPKAARPEKKPNFDREVVLV